MWTCRGGPTTRKSRIRRALLNHQVIFFDDQHLTVVQHRDFAARFSALHTHPL